MWLNTNWLTSQASDQNGTESAEGGAYQFMFAALQFHEKGKHVRLVSMKYGQFRAYKREFQNDQWQSILH